MSKTLFTDIVEDVLKTIEDILKTTLVNADEDDLIVFLPG